jgi:hypothetical protein
VFSLVVCCVECLVLECLQFLAYCEDSELNHFHIRVTARFEVDISASVDELSVNFLMTRIFTEIITLSGSISIVNWMEGLKLRGG